MTDIDAVAEAIYLARDDISGISPRPWTDNRPTKATRNEYRRMAQAAIDALGLTPFWAVAYGDGGQGEECYEQRDSAEEMLAEYADATGLNDGYLVTASFTSWVRDEKPVLDNSEASPLQSVPHQI